MTTIDIEKLKNLDLGYPGIEIASELRGLEISIKSLDEFLPFIQQQYQIRGKRALDNEMENIDLGDEYKGQYSSQEEQSIENIANIIFPRFFRATFIGSIWAVYESAIYDFCDYLKEKEGKKLSLKDIRGKNHKDKLIKYFEGVLNISVPIDDTTFKQLEITSKIRNLVAHRNGRIVKEQNVEKELLHYLKASNGISIVRGEIVISEEYIKTRFLQVKEVLRVIDQVIADRYNWSCLIS